MMEITTGADPDPTTGRVREWINNTPPIADLPTADTLIEIRTAIEIIDDRIADALHERLGWVIAATLHKNTVDEVQAPKRQAINIEHAVDRAVKRDPNNPGSHELVRNVYRVLVLGSVALQTEAFAQTQPIDDDTPPVSSDTDGSMIGNIKSVLAESKASQATIEMAQAELKRKQAALLAKSILELAASEGTASPVKRSEQKHAIGLLIRGLGLTHSLRQVLVEECPIDREDLGKRIRQARVRLDDISFRSLALETGVPRLTIADIENASAKPTLHDHILARLGETLGL